MTALACLVIAVAAAYSVALAVPHLRRKDGTAGPATWCLAPALFACPLLIPPDHVVARALAMFVSGDLFFRVVDYLRHCHRNGPCFAPREYRRFLVPFPVLLVVFAEWQRRLPRPVPIVPEVTRVMLGAAGVGAALLLLAALSNDSVCAYGELARYAAQLAAFVLAIESASRALFGLERLAGFDTRPLVRGISCSRTVAEFWRRYNCRVHDWLIRNIFLPVGGRRAPARGVLLVFLASGLLHELAFGIATSRFDGSQLLFFLLQAPGVLISGPLERLARNGIVGKVLARGSAVLWLSVTAPLFFRGVGRIFPALDFGGHWLP